jgi:hypothetical protein
MLRQMAVRAATRTGGIAGALLVLGCGQGAGGSGALDGGASSMTVDCGGSVYDADVLTDAPPASSLAEGPAGAVDDAGRPAFDSALEWYVVHQDDDRVDLVRPLEEPVDNGGGDIRTHESRRLERITGASNVPDGTWMLTSAGPCAQRVVGGDGLGAADVTLARTPAPETSTLDLLIRERACASGKDADGRAVVDLEETAEQVRLRVGVRPLRGGQDCQGNPATPLTVELAEPLGDREVVDSSVVPARPVTVAAPD